MDKSQLLIIITGKTASGKDTVVKGLLERFPDFKKVVTTTTRSPRPGEISGQDMNFISREDFKARVERGDFIEWVEYGGNLYGTEKQQLASVNLIWRIDPSRAGQIRDLIKNKKIIVIYLTVDDMVVLERLKKRGLTETEIEKRMREDKQFWQQYQGNYNFVVENAPGKLDETLDRIMQIITRAST